MSGFLVVTADLLVGILLVATIVSSVRLSRRISGLKADEAAMRATIGELVAATEAAERAVSGLRKTLAECDEELADRIRTAQRQGQELARAIAAGEKVMGGLERVFDATRRALHASPPPTASVPAEEPRPGGPLQAALAAAQAVAERSARRLESRAA
ncbi:DUF6468 domain-containing protein [Enterovirga aerilata]|uniref:Glutamyl-tRNA reductase n=1 Tax=Enterovirga aerilata TaxID=2730920 RepID=A0A849HVR9_9HYPH|nr:DUF6468 domain-containing protein [Enterovirga sp. DB1703]NNM71636.1 glutamyl-tRNA reductase [Enterovirga sp. DB1703]